MSPTARIDEKSSPSPRASGGWGVLLALALAAAGCFYHPGPPRVPLRTLAIPGSAAESRCLVVFLPGRGDTPEHFVRNGFPEKLRRAGSRCAMIGVDSHMGYFFERTITQRLEEDVIAPARAQGFEEIWLVGISLGGFGSLLYTKDHPGEIAGIVTLAPYLGERELTDEIANAGGAESWTPRNDPERPEQQDFLAFWDWLKGYRHPETNPDAGHPPLFLVIGSRDRFARPNGLVADLLPADHVFRVDGGHTWAAWRRGWDAFLASPYVPGR
jgi:pimeloyl-ACP methyl ester carboxylesterase